MSIFFIGAVLGGFLGVWSVAIIACWIMSMVDNRSE